MKTIGIIADTHGLLRPEAVAALRDVDLILHAGDIGRPEIIAGLTQLAPVTAIRGNVDRWAGAERYPESCCVEVDAVRIFMIHRLQDFSRDSATGPVHAVVTGHSHRPSLQWDDDVLYLNPGSAGPRRFTLPVTLALLRLEGSTLRPDIIELAVPPPRCAARRSS